MKTISTFIFLFFGCCLATNLFATPVYKSTNKEGKILYSDQKEQDSEKILLPPVQTYTPAPLSQQVTSSQEEAPERKTVENYKIVITQPTKEQVFTTEIQDIEVHLFLQPELHENDRIILQLNGKDFGGFRRETDINLGRLDRGRYDIQAFVYSKTNKQKPKGQSEIITIYQIREMIRSATP